MSSTTEHVADGNIETMTPSTLRYALRRARQRVATLVAMVDDLQRERSALRARVRRLENQLDQVRDVASAIGA
jgi:uncharacterized protein YlxW (UPF0749 family)